jgi:hypothetical protein
MKIDEYEEQSSFYNDQIIKIEEFLGFIDRVWHQVPPPLPPPGRFLLILSLV